MTAPVRLFILVGTVGLLVLIVVVGSSTAPTALKAANEGEGSTPGGGGEARQPQGRLVAKANSTPDVIMGEPLPASMNPPRPTSLPVTRRAPVETARRAAVPTQRLDRWTVGEGDTLGSIAAETLGSAHRWREIAALNPSVDHKALKLGAVLKLPTSSASPTPSERPLPAAVFSVQRTHVVSANESLSSIAQQYLGSQNDWKRIYQANRALLKNGPDSIRVGMKLIIPAG
jgi:nucleoid-associated protein YgaU